ncbi:MAG: DUF2339 domain-containing protein, partial [Leadbetterella sp.]|nr:DUF2339 domain-containing protein [Leadbetterella sp.]
AYHVTFLVLMQLFVLQRKSWVYKPFLWISMASLAALPLFINFFIIHLREMAVRNGGAASGSFYFHFIAIIPLIALMVITTSNIKTVYHRIKETATWILLFRIGFIVYLILAEFDHISVISGNTKHYGEDIIAANRYLPYSIVFFLTSLVLVLFSFAKNIKLLRQLSLMVLFFTTLKVFVIDFSTFSPTGQVLAFWIMGGFLLLYSFLYQQLRKINFDNTPSKKERSSRHHHSHAVAENELD